MLKQVQFARIVLAGVSVAIVLVASGVARADEIPAGEVVVAEEVIPPAPPEEPCCRWIPFTYFDEGANAVTGWLDQYGIELSSGLSAAYQYDFNEPGNRKTGQRLLNQTHNRFYLDLFQLTVSHNAAPKPGEWGVLGQFDVGRIARNIKADWNGSGLVPDTSWEHHEIEFQQAYLAYNVPIGNGLTLKGGKMNTLVGAEVIEPWLNFNYSRSFLFDFSGPFTHVGGYASYPFTEMITLTAGGYIGWDNVQDNNSSPGAIAQLALTPSDYFSLTFNGTYSPEQSCNPDTALFPNGENCNRNKRGFFETVASIKPPWEELDGLGLLLDYVYATEDEASLVNPGRHAPWTGFSGILYYSFLQDCLTAALRGEWFQDPQGSRLAGNLSRVDLSPTNQTLWEVTFDIKAMLSEYMYVRAEYRHDESSEDTFLVGDTIYHPGQDTVAFEIGYYF